MNIYKYILANPRGPIQFVRMHGLTPSILSAQVQSDRIVLWAEVDPTAEMQIHQFKILMTGEEVKTGVYIATLQLFELVFHIYYMGPFAE